MTVTNSSGRKTEYIFVFGATGCGKSDLISTLFERHNISLVSVDSVQIYRSLNIGSAKPSKEFMALHPHYLIDIREPDDRFCTADFIQEADRAVADIQSKGRVPVFSGGTAYYFRNYVYGLSGAPQADPVIRAEVDQIEAEQGIEVLYRFLAEVDSVSAGRIHPNDTYRIKRAVEVYKQTGRPLSSFLPSEKKINDYRAIGLYREKFDLVKRIEQRLDNMFSSGLVEEIESLKKRGINSGCQSVNSIGYREFFDPALSTVKEIKEKIRIDTIHYAKRQMTFFRSFESVDWFNLTKGENPLMLLGDYIDYWSL